MYFAYNIFKCILFNENEFQITFHLKYVAVGRIADTSVLVEVIACGSEGWAFLHSKNFFCFELE